MAGYVVATYDVSDQEEYVEYVGLVVPSFQAHRAQVLVADADVAVKEGEAREHNVVIQFPSVEAAKNWYDSDEYKPARDFRLNGDWSSNMTFFIASSFEG